MSKLSAGSRRRRGRCAIGADVLEARVLLATYVVDNPGDANDGVFTAGNQTLREAVDRANLNPGADTIEFSSSLFTSNSVSIQTRSRLIISGEVTINGPVGRRLRVSAQNGGFEILASGSLTVRDITVKGEVLPESNARGGAFLNSGSLRIERSSVEGKAEDMTLTNDGQGGAIYNNGSLRIADSSVTGMASEGAGIYQAGGSAKIVNTTFSGISTGLYGLDGGAMFVDSGTVEIRNSTIAGNTNTYIPGTRGVGVFINDANGADVLIHNSVFVENPTLTESDESVEYNIHGTLNPASSHNILSGVMFAGGLTNGVNGNIVGDGTGGLLDFEDIFTRNTLTPHLGSLVVNAGNNAEAIDLDGGPLRKDRTGRKRIIGGTVDIGAIEFATRTDVAKFDHVSSRWVFGESVASGYNFASTRVVDWSQDVTWEPVSGDFNGDGKMDVAGRIRESGDWYALITNAAFPRTSHFGRWASDADRGWQFVQVGDFNEDGLDDLLGLDNQGFWWTGISDGTGFSMKTLGRWHATGWTSIQVGDFDGDGYRDDIAGFRQESGTWWGAFSNGTRFETRYLGTWNSSFTWQDFMVGHMTGDGTDEILARTSTGYWFIGGVNSTGRLQTTPAGRTGDDPGHGIPVLGDFNGDGRDDLAYATSLNQIWVKPAHASGMGSPQRWGTLDPDAAGTLFGGDFNGDGYDDLMGLSNYPVPTQYYRTILYSSTETGFADALDFGGLAVRLGPSKFFTGELTPFQSRQRF